MNYSVKDHIGVNCITLSDGQKVYEVIYPELSQRHEVELDFKDVRIVASPFLNAAIGQLLRDFTSEELSKYLKITNLSALVRPTLRRVIENAREYYTNDVAREAVDRVLEKEVSNRDAD